MTSLGLVTSGADISGVTQKYIWPFSWLSPNSNSQFFSNKSAWPFSLFSQNSQIVNFCLKKIRLTFFHRNLGIFHFWFITTKLYFYICYTLLSKCDTRCGPYNTYLPVDATGNVQCPLSTLKLEQILDTQLLKQKHLIKIIYYYLKQK